MTDVAVLLVHGCMDQRVCGEKSTVGYRPFGFGTTQQPLQHEHAVHSENFAWGFPYQPAACPDFTVGACVAFLTTCLALHFFFRSDAFLAAYLTSLSFRFTCLPS